MPARRYLAKWTPIEPSYEDRILEVLYRGRPRTWQRDYPGGVSGVVDQYADRSTWILFVIGGPNIDAGTTVWPEDAMKEVDEAAKSQRTRDIVSEWRRSARDIPFGGGKLRIRPYLQQREPYFGRKVYIVLRAGRPDGVL